MVLAGGLRRHLKEEMFEWSTVSQHQTLLDGPPQNLLAFLNNTKARISNQLHSSKIKCHIPSLQLASSMEVETHPGTPDGCLQEAVHALLFALILRAQR